MARAPAEPRNARAQALQELSQLQVRSAHLQDDGQQERRLASQVDIRATVQGLPQLPKLGGAGSSAEYPLRRRSFPLQDSQQLLRERQEDRCLPEELPSNSGGQSAAPAAAPCPQTGLGAEACCGGEEPNAACAELLGTASASAEQAQGGLGTAWPGWLTWMGWGSAPSSPQRAARGWPKSARLQPEPARPGAWAAAGVRRRAKGQGSPLLLLLLLPPAAKEKRARARQCRAPGQRSRSLPCPALPCLQRGAERCGRTGREPAAGRPAVAQRLGLGGS